MRDLIKSLLFVTVGGRLKRWSPWLGAFTVFCGRSDPRNSGDNSQCGTPRP
jgi:hypothetical protein